MQRHGISWDPVFVSLTQSQCCVHVRLHPVGDGGEQCEEVDEEPAGVGGAAVDTDDTDCGESVRVHGRVLAERADDTASGGRTAGRHQAAAGEGRGIGGRCAEHLPNA